LACRTAGPRATRRPGNAAGGRPVARRTAEMVVAVGSPRLCSRR